MHPGIGKRSIETNLPVSQSVSQSVNMAWTHITVSVQLLILSLSFAFFWQVENPTVTFFHANVNILCL